MNPKLGRSPYIHIKAGRRCLSTPVSAISRSLREAFTGVPLCDHTEANMWNLIRWDGATDIRLMMIRGNQEDFGNRYQVTKPFISKENPSVLLQSDATGTSLKSNKIERKGGSFSVFCETVIVDGKILHQADFLYCCIYTRVSQMETLNTIYCAEVVQSCITFQHNLPHAQCKSSSAYKVHKFL